jgi:tetratricopeptide (TPR) repeat protein
MSWFSGIRHNNLGIIFDAGLTPKGDLYCVREYLPISELFSAESLTVIKTLISAVDFLQSNRRVHGAIKPSNIFLSNGCLKLTDPDFKATESHQTEETIRFSAPEVLRGETPDLESDLYSVGAVLYRVLTQRNLFEDSNLAHLIAKYVWAAPAPMGNLSDVPKAISELVINLLDKDPQKRLVAFTSMKERIGVEPAHALRAPFIGHEALLNETVEIISQPSAKGLRGLLVEGIPGIGKSRFIEELRIRCAFAGLMFLGCDCMRVGESQSVCQTIREFLRSVNPAGGNPHSLLNASRDGRSDTETQQIYLNEVISELLLSLADSIRQKHFIIAIENVEHADLTTLRLIEQLSFRAAELPLTLLLSERGSKSEPKLLAILKRLSDRLRRIRIPPLAAAETQQLKRYLETSAKQIPDLQQLSGGNPLFIEDYARCNFADSDRRNEALTWMLSQISKDAQGLVEALAIVRRPIDLKTVAKITVQDLPSLEAPLSDLADLGIIERRGPEIRIAYPSLALLIYRGISRRHKLDLAKRTFEVLRASGDGTEDLAYYAFEAGMFKEAGNLYKQCAGSAFTQQNYPLALIQYEQLSQCEVRGQAEFPPAEKIHLAICYQKIGRQRLARDLYENLLSSNTVRNDPEVLSQLYTSMASRLERIPAPERIRLRRLSIECLPANSSTSTLRYLQLCETLLKVGDLAAATEALECAEKSPFLDHKLYLETVRAEFFLNLGDFRRAAACMPRRDRRPGYKILQLHNLALCFENLGYLTKAFEYQTRAQQIAASKSSVQVQILSLANLGSIRTKCGEMRKAEQFFEDALSWIERLQRRETTFDIGRFITVHSDVALHSIHLGKYRRAADCLKRIRPSVGSVLEQDRSYSGTVQCLFYREIGFMRKVRSLLAELKSCETFNSSYLQVEKPLL